MAYLQTILFYGALICGGACFKDRRQHPRSIGLSPFTQPELDSNLFSVGSMVRSFQRVYYCGAILISRNRVLYPKYACLTPDNTTIIKVPTTPEEAGQVNKKIIGITPTFDSDYIYVDLDSSAPPRPSVPALPPSYRNVPPSAGTPCAVIGFTESGALYRIETVILTTDECAGAWDPDNVSSGVYGDVVRNNPETFFCAYLTNSGTMEGENLTGMFDNPATLFCKGWDGERKRWWWPSKDEDEVDEGYVFAGTRYHDLSGDDKPPVIFQFAGPAFHP